MNTERGVAVGISLLIEQARNLLMNSRNMLMGSVQSGSDPQMAQKRWQQSSDSLAQAGFGLGHRPIQPVMSD